MLRNINLQKEGKDMEILKKSATVCGTLMLPLCVGNRALILHDGGYIHTSKVEAIHSVSANEIRFETRNTCYRLLPAPVSQVVDSHPAMEMAA